MKFMIIFFRIKSYEYYYFYLQFYLFVYPIKRRILAHLDTAAVRRHINWSD